ncbi:heparinase II/III domain-containing protein [Sediminibacterium ginsengisoli]|uniref:Alginate lyase n=1 Tax=Sediminibacterium ginsengisoli TaxID=413434 RepID=A0A1T4PA87_9BACT|nr:heparinase II/III family protein [Sediminibacterium ginsengisoli]SJZ88247.1 Alginate lyase [Sediminibacterium ginsengisoli]
MKKIVFLIMGGLCSVIAFAQHPSLMLTRKGVSEIRAGIDKYPLLASSFREVKADADKALLNPIVVPVPADGGGGVTHEQHKKNYQYVLACGTAYQITGEKKYADYVKDMLLKYAAEYKRWPRHPKRRQEPGGKIFWQNLNDAVWGVYMIQGYDCVYDALSAADRNKIETDLFAEMVNEMSVVNSKVFNLIHNHATWNVAAVGMAGYVCGRKEWVDLALRGTAKDGKTGFLAQLDQLFSPDGYYTEGPYYQRYAILPFMVFAKAIRQYQPELNIYDYRNGVLKKAVNTSLQCTYTNKAFFPLNDAMKDKTYESEELVYAVDIAYSDFGSGNELLDIARQQNRVIVSDAGLKVAKAVAADLATPFVYTPMWISDGSNGKEGGIGILRSGSNKDQTCVVMKAASQGMGHGHFDRLNVLFYDNNTEVLNDYGAVRFLNVETKNGGGYTKENDAWGKATVAHNTLVVDRQNQFGGKMDEASKFSPQLVYFNAGKTLQVVSAVEEHAYKGVKLLRTAVLFKPDGAAGALLLDIFKATSSDKHRYDLPFWYTGHITNINFAYRANATQLLPLGDKDGYQHIWLNAEGKPGIANGAVTFLNNNKFYTTTFLSDTSLKVNFITCGANDPEFNLRSEKAYMLSAEATDRSFVSITEPHGKTNPVAEFTTGFMPAARNIRMLTDTPDSTVFSFEYNKRLYTVTIRYNSKDEFITIK